MVLREERAVIPIGSYSHRFGVTLSLPSIVGRGGVVQTFEPEMSREERQALESSAASLKISESRTDPVDHQGRRILRRFTSSSGRRRPSAARRDPAPAKDSRCIPSRPRRNTSLDRRC